MQIFIYKSDVYAHCTHTHTVCVCTVLHTRLYMSDVYSCTIIKNTTWPFTTVFVCACHSIFILCDYIESPLMYECVMYTDDDDDGGGSGDDGDDAKNNDNNNNNSQL